MDKKIIFFIGIGSLILTLLTIILSIVVSNKVLEREVYYASLYVADYGGFDVNRTAFTFGAIPPGSSGERKLNVKNSYDFPIVAYIIPEDEIEQFVQPLQEVIPANQERNISIVANVPNGYEKKKYEGEIIVELRKS